MARTLLMNLCFLLLSLLLFVSNSLFARGQQSALVQPRHRSILIGIPGQGRMTGLLKGQRRPFSFSLFCQPMRRVTAHASPSKEERTFYRCPNFNTTQHDTQYD
jgi:hypothetical protein